MLVEEFEQQIRLTAPPQTGDNFNHAVMLAAD